MNSLFYFLFFLVFFSIGSNDIEQKHLRCTDVEMLQYQKKAKTLNLEFPVKPEVTTEILPMRGHHVNLKTHLASSDSGGYMLIELELGELKNEVTQDVRGFFDGFLSFIMNDMGAQVSTFADFSYEGFKGYDFNIISPNKDEKRTARGKTLLVDDRAYIWFGISNDTNSSQKVNQFINSYSLNEDNFKKTGK